MAERSRRTSGPDNRRRLIILTTTAVLAVAVVGFAMIQSNREAAKQDKLVELDNEEVFNPGYKIDPKGNVNSSTVKKPGVASGDASSTDAEGGGSSKSTPVSKSGDGLSDEDNDRSVIFNNNDKNDPDYPVTSKPGSTDPKSVESQKTGEQILDDLANGVTTNRDKALADAAAAFEKAIKADPANLNAQYGLAYVHANIASSQFLNSKKSDDAAAETLLSKAVTEGEKVRTEAKAKNPDLSEAAFILVRDAKQFLADLK